MQGGHKYIPEFDVPALIRVCPSAKTDSKIDCNSFAFLARSALSVSMKNKQDIPSKHPVTTPTHPPKVCHALDDFRSNCWRDRLWCGSCILATAASTTPPQVNPATSLKHCPNPAAVMVLNPKDTPMDMSMASPAWIMTKLSINPNPIMGIADRRATSRNCREVGSSTATAAAAAAVEEVEVSLDEEESHRGTHAAFQPGLLATIFPRIAWLMMNAFMAGWWL